MGPPQSKAKRGSFLEIDIFIFVSIVILKKHFSKGAKMNNRFYIVVKATKPLTASFLQQKIKPLQCIEFSAKEQVEHVCHSGKWRTLFTVIASDKSKAKERLEEKFSIIIISSNKDEAVKALDCRFLGSSQTIL